MIVILCLDDKGGMMFNGRRQSRDRCLRERVAALVGEGELWMNAYSAKQFAEMTLPGLRVEEDFLHRAGEGAYCFVEEGPLAPVEAQIERLIVFWWNRSYPADRYLDLSLTEGEWHGGARSDFVGSSHEMITMEVYER